MFLSNYNYLSNQTYPLNGFFPTFSVSCLTLCRKLKDTSTSSLFFMHLLVIKCNNLTNQRVHYIRPLSPQLHYFASVPSASPPPASYLWVHQLIYQCHLSTLQIPKQLPMFSSRTCTFSHVLDSRCGENKKKDKQNGGGECVFFSYSECAVYRGVCFIETVIV